MSVEEAMVAVGAGRGHPRLLGACRLEIGGFDAFGVEAIGDAFRRDPWSLDGGATIEDRMYFAAVGGGQGLFADLYDGNIGRLWRVGRTAPHDAEPFVSVPFDPDLQQARGDLAFAPGDHPRLMDDAKERVQDVGLAILAADATAWRSRAFCIRAFGDSGQGAALFALYRMSGKRVRVSGFGYAAALWQQDEIELAVDAVPFAGDARIRIVP